MIAFAIAKQIVNNVITMTSINTVTPTAVFVNGPLALISLIIAKADEGDLATKMDPNKSEIANLVNGGSSLIKLICPDTQ